DLKSEATRFKQRHISATIVVDVKRFSHQSIRMKFLIHTAVRQLAVIANDDLIAGILNRNGLVTGNGNRWTRERVTSLRSHHRISVYKPAAAGIDPWLNLSNAARLLRISPRTLRLAAQAGEIEAIHPPPDGPWIFSRTALSTSSARAVTERARQNPKYPTGSHPHQQSLFSSITSTDGCCDAQLEWHHTLS